jgi:Tol biopolymer transport system component
LSLTGPAQATGLTVALGTQGEAVYAVSDHGDLVYSAPSSGRSLLAWVDRAGVEQVVDADLWRNFNGVSVSPDGSRLALGIADPSQSAVWTYRLDDRTMSRLTFDGTLTWRPQWSGDGLRIAYSSDRASPTQKRAIWVQSADGSGVPEILVESERHAQEITWSADGRSIAYREGFTDGATLRDIYVLRAGDDTTRRPFAASGADEQNPKLSPDGRWLAYVSNQSSANEVYVRPFPEGSGRWQISAGGGTEPLWARNGAELFYRNGERDLVAVPVTTAGGFRPGAPRVLFSTTTYFSDPNATTYDITPDGRRFLMIKRPVDQELVVVLNWVQELRTP